jgi:hypothetical protein
MSAQWCHETVGTTRVIRNDKYGPARLQGGTTRAIRNDKYGSARLLGGITGVKDDLSRRASESFYYKLQKSACNRGVLRKIVVNRGEDSLDSRTKGEALSNGVMIAENIVKA